MTTDQKKTIELNEFTENLKPKIKAWLKSSDTQQNELADVLGITASAVSANLRMNHPMTENFIRNLSQNVPNFSGVFLKYFEIKSGISLSPSVVNTAKEKKINAKKIKVLRQAEKEVIDAIRALSDLAVKSISE